ncbi:hypothetical protein BV20DRAFT_956278 [Pilatotrama ljubarskyi]|nr:hypothetical protein BV20DRAFT_956278 [Pilatotrama ljubarskyi]
MDPGGTVHEPPVLHVDLIYAIIDHLQDAKRTLAQCSLVGRSWLAPSRRHLFRSMTVRATGPRASGGLQAFISFLQASSDARAFLRFLTLDCDAALNRDSPSRHTLDEDQITAILNAAVNLHHLRINGAHFTGRRPSSSLANSINPSLSLNHLEFTDNHPLEEELFVALLDIICSFAHIGTLVLNVYISSPDGPALQKLERYADEAVFPAIRSLIYQLPTTLPLMPLYRAMQRSNQTHESLTSISFIGLRRTQTRRNVHDFCETIISGARKTLQDLEFHPEVVVLYEAASESQAWDMPDLSECHCLRQLTLPLECQDMPYSGQELAWQLDAHSNMLKQLPPPSLERLMFKVRIPYNRDTSRYLALYVKYLESHQPSYDALDLALVALPSSPQVIFDFVGPWCGIAPVQDLQRCMQGLLPCLHEKGLLRAVQSTSFPRWRY